MNVTKSDIEKWNELDSYMYGRASDIIDVILIHRLDNSVRRFHGIDRITIDIENNVIDISFSTYCMGEYDRDNYISFPVEWFESDCDYKKKIFEQYNYTPGNDEE